MKEFVDYLQCWMWAKNTKESTHVKLLNICKYFYYSIDFFGRTIMQLLIDFLPCTGFPCGFFLYVYKSYINYSSNVLSRPSRTRIYTLNLIIAISQFWVRNNWFFRNLNIPTIESFKIKLRLVGKVSLFLSQASILL